MEYIPSCIAGRQFGTQFLSFYATLPIINGWHQLTTEPFPEPNESSLHVTPTFCEIHSNIINLSPHLLHGRKNVFLDLRYYANKLCQTIPPTRLYIVT